MRKCKREIKDDMDMLISRENGGCYYFSCHFKVGITSCIFTVEVNQRGKICYIFPLSLKRHRENHFGDSSECFVQICKELNTRLENMNYLKEK